MSAFDCMINVSAYEGSAARSWPGGALGEYNAWVVRGPMGTMGTADTLALKTGLGTVPLRAGPPPHVRQKPVVFIAPHLVQNCPPPLITPLSGVCRFLLLIWTRDDSVCHYLQALLLPPTTPLLLLRNSKSRALPKPR